MYDNFSHYSSDYRFLCSSSAQTKAPSQETSQAKLVGRRAAIYGMWDTVEKVA